jgi:hypothetical protein
MTHTTAMKLALDALVDSVDVVRSEYETVVELYGKYSPRAARIDGMLQGLKRHEDAIAALQAALGEKGNIGHDVTSPSAEPVAWIEISVRGTATTIDNHFADCVRDWPCGEYQLYPHPPVPKPLTTDEVTDAMLDADIVADPFKVLKFARAIKAAIRGKT